MADDARTVALRYFEALADRDVERGVACWTPGGIDRFIGQQDLTAPDGVRDYFTTLFAAFPDFTFEVLQVTTEEERCSVQYRITGTFAGDAPFQGFDPNGARIDIEGCDVVEVADGLITRNSAYIDAASIARQLGALPPVGSKAEARMASLFNLKTKAVSKLGPSEPEPVADGVWLVRGGIPHNMNVYLIEEPSGGVVLFDAGIEGMAKGVAAAAARFGGINRVVLGHGHADHRGLAPELGAPVWCHANAKADAEGDGGYHLFDLSQLENPVVRKAYPALLRHWDGGPVPITGTLAEGDEVAGFRVVDIPGHAVGMIALFRESDRLALTSDCFYTLDPQTGKWGAPRLPHRAFNADQEQTRASVRKLAALEPAAAWPGHADPITGDVRAQLEHAAATT